MKFNFKYKQRTCSGHCQWLEKDQPLVLRWAAHFGGSGADEDDDIDEDSNTIEDDDEYKVEAVESMPERIPKIKGTYILLLCYHRSPVQCRYLY